MRQMPERPMICPMCGATMNQHAEKVVYTGDATAAGVDAALGGVVEEMHACPRCGYVTSRQAG
jgi:ribosomal protein S27AE